MKKFHILLFISILITACQSNTGSKSGQEIDKSEQSKDMAAGSDEPVSDQKIAKTEKSIAYKLAVLEKGGYVSEDDQIVKRFDNLLQQLDNKYDVNKQQIFDMTYKLKEVAKERGLKVSMIKVMEGATQVNNLTYPEYLGSYLTLIEKGYNHDDAINSIKLLYGM